MSTVFVTGAGISVPSGIPAYRNSGSGWDDPRLEEISQYKCYGNHLEELWEHWERLYYTCNEAEPNKAHVALAKTNKRVLTQNVDSLHTKAGGTNLHLHGLVAASVCMRCGTTFPTPMYLKDRECPGCESKRVRLRVTLFGEPLSKVSKAALRDAEKADLVVFIGTSGNVWPVAGLPEKVQQNGGRAVLLNGEEWGTFDEVVLGDVEDIVPEYLERISNG